MIWIESPKDCSMKTALRILLYLLGWAGVLYGGINLMFYGSMALSDSSGPAAEAGDEPGVGGILLLSTVILAVGVVFYRLARKMRSSRPEVVRRSPFDPPEPSEEPVTD